MVPLPKGSCIPIEALVSHTSDIRTSIEIILLIIEEYAMGTGPAMLCPTGERWADAEAVQSPTSISVAGTR